MIYLPIIGALLEATGMIFEKKILKKRGMNFKNYTVFEFAAIVLALIPILLFTWRVDKGALTLVNIGIMAFVILVSVLANLLVFYSLKREDVTEFEPVWLMQPLFTVLLAVLLFQSERDYYAVGLALIASVALIALHFKKHHLYFNKYLIAALIGSLLFSVELVASRYVLDYYSGFSFYFIESIG
jgi:drug/metabolite transporter (DMT)-like permease